MGDVPRARCEAVTAAGRPCSRSALVGQSRCAQHLGRAHRPTGLTPEVQTELARLFRAGNYPVAAAAAAGVPRSTFHRWMALGEGPDAQEPYAQFRAAIDRAKAEGEALNVSQIAKAAASDWKAAAWLLERTQPERWARPSQRKEEESDARSVPSPLDELARRRRASAG